MRAVIGLGNPGAKYRTTRHNAGFMVVEELARRFAATDKKTALSGNYDSWTALINGQKVLLAEPLTYMNLSGAAVAEIMRKHYLSPEDIIVVQDDIDMELASVKIRRGGSSGGHRGIESIISSLGTSKFARVKLGVGRDPSLPVESYVLKKFPPEEKEKIDEAISKAAGAVVAIIKDGLDKAMNGFN